MSQAIAILFELVRRRSTGVLSALILCGTLIAGLWPFHSPKNDVSWLENGNGIHFGDHATIVSPGPITLVSPDAPSCSLEIWVEPDFTWRTGTLLAFYSPSNPKGFRLRQCHKDLTLQNEAWTGQEHCKPSSFYVDKVFRKGRPAFITVSSDGRDLAVYLDGQLVKKLPHFGLSSRDLVAQLVIANSPLDSDSWPGQLRGLAIYGSELSAGEVAQHYEDWTQRGRPTLSKNDDAVALYLLDEHKGQILYSQVRPVIRLLIPERYSILHQILLESPWSEYRPGWGYWKNVLINIGGFIPLGFSFYAYLSSARQRRWVTWKAVTLGFGVSLTIELLQAFLPTRYSGVTDLITNTIGTGIGVLVYLFAASRLARLGGGESLKPAI